MLNNKVILQIVPALNNGGVERGVIETSKFLVKNNNKSIVISSGGVYEHLISRHGGILYKLDVHLKNPLKWKKLRIKVEEIIKKEKVDLIHVCSRVPAWITYPIAENLKIPFVTSVHGRLRNQNFLKNYYNSILIKGDVIIAISKHIKDNIVNVFPNVKDKVSIVYRGVDLENFNLNNISNTRIVNQAKLLGVRDGSPVILMASRPKAWKGHLIFIKALSKVKVDYQCFLIGALDGDEKFKRDIYKQISELNLGNKVKLTKSTNDIQSAFVLSDIVVMPSIDPEPFGRIIIEAQALKKIAIGFDHGGISESIIDNETGLLAKPLDVNDLGKKIETALKFNKTQRKIINNNAIKILKEKFSLDKMCTDTLNLYKNCIDKYN